MAIFLGTEAWFHDGGIMRDSAWELVPPSASKSVAISESAALDLGYDRSSAATWNDPDGSQWMLYFFEWKAGPTRSRVLARLHAPDKCLSAVGLKLIEDRGTFIVHANDQPLAFRAYTFEDRGRALFVYHGIWQNRSERAEKHGAFDSSMQRASLQAVLWRERNLGQQVAEIAVSGYPSATAADAALGEMIRKIIVWNRTPSR